MLGLLLALPLGSAAAVAVATWFLLRDIPRYQTGAALASGLASIPLTLILASQFVDRAGMADASTNAVSWQVGVPLAFASGAVGVVLAVVACRYFRESL